MEDVTVKKDDLLTEIRANRDAHQAIFEEAVAGYGAKLKGILESHLADVEAGRIFEVRVNMPEPENHIKDYDRAIKMIVMNVNDQIVLDEQDFRSYVMDDWGWKRQFLASNAHYSETATTSLARDY